MERILISGASGLIGSALGSSLESHGHEVTRLVRRPARTPYEIPWDPLHRIPPDLVSGFEAVIHLSGESVAGRWTEAKKKRIGDSRVVSTQNLAQALADAKQRPSTLVCASAIGYYGNRGDQLLSEESPSGTGFLPEVCRQWEAATHLAAHAGIRTVNLRIGLVLSRDGGALKQMLLPFRFGLGGRIGSGRQWWSWIHISDLVAAVDHILQNTFADSTTIVEPQTIVERRASPPGLQLTGAINMVSPNPVTNAEFTRTLAKVLKRPAILPIPAFAARLAFGELADEGVLASTKVEPRKLMESGFEFEFPQLGWALQNIL